MPKNLSDWVQYILIALLAGYLLFSGKHQIFYGIFRHTFFPSKEGKIEWKQDYDEAFAEAKRLSRPVFVLLTAPDWCVYCQALDESTLRSEKLVKMLDEDFVPLKITDTNGDRARFSFSSFPTMLVMTPSGKELVRINGFAGTQRLISVLESAEKKATD